MTEEYLHFIWKTRRFFSTSLSDVSGGTIVIKRVGIHNLLNGGPDFGHAVIKIDEVELHGPIEIHVKSSDWYNHNHHNDSAYDNVVLHIVYSHDREVVQNGRKLPVLELRGLIDWDHYHKFELFRSNNHEIICGGQLQYSDPIFLKSMMEKALYEKICRKIDAVMGYVSNEQDALYFFLGAAYGGNQNMYPFLSLLRNVPSERLRELSPKKRYSLLLSESGVTERVDSLGERWHFKGSRPGNFPTKRIHQFALFFCVEELKLLVELTSAREVVEVFHEVILSQSQELRLTKSFREHLLINAIVPYFFYLAQKEQDEKFEECAFEVLSLLSPEKNRITKKWEGVGVLLKSALESQGAIALHRYFCAVKKCLACEVGSSILRG